MSPPPPCPPPPTPTPPHPPHAHTHRTEQGTRLTSTFAPYTQYEVAIPFEIAGDCLLEVRRRGCQRLAVGGGCPHIYRPDPHASLPPLAPPHPNAQVGREIYGSRKLSEGFRNPALIRFVSGEEPYLSGNHGGPRMWINFGG